MVTLSHTKIKIESGVEAKKVEQLMGRGSNYICQLRKKLKPVNSNNNCLARILHGLN